MGTKTASGLPGISPAKINGAVVWADDVDGVTSRIGVARDALVADALVATNSSGVAVVQSLILRGAGDTGLLAGVTYPRVAIAPLSTSSIANGANFAIASSSENGFLIIETSNAEAAIAHIRGGFNAVSIALAVQGTWGTTLGAANNFNVYYDSGTSTYRIENRSGSARQFKVCAMGWFS